MRLSNSRISINSSFSNGSSSSAALKFSTGYFPAVLTYCFISFIHSLIPFVTIYLLTHFFSHLKIYLLLYYASKTAIVLNLNLQTCYRMYDRSWCHQTSLWRQTNYRQFYKVVDRERHSVRWISLSWDHAQVHRTEYQ